jgi:prepilin-type N-terminal cleavage/methylation domain-containing protein
MQKCTRGQAGVDSDGEMGQYMDRYRSLPMKQSRRTGFTLVEVLTVIAIIALLAALILGLAGNAQKKAARSKAEAEITQIGSAITDFQRKYGRVPATRDALRTELQTVNHSLTNMVDPWGMDYQYRTSSVVTFYLWSLGGDTSNPATNRALWVGNPAP